MYKKLTQSLSTRLFLWLLAVMMIGFAFYAYMTVTNHTESLMNTIFLSANRTSDVIKKSTRYGMLINRKEDVHQIINTISTEPGVDGIRIYNKKGDIVFSSNPEDIGQTADMRAEACIICHAEKEPLQAVTSKERTRVYRVTDGHRVMGVINPIENEQECYNAACHAHEAEQKILGVLDVKMSLAFVDNQLNQTRKEMIIFAFIMVVVLVLFAGVFIYLFVRRRINELILGTKEIASGNLNYRLESRHRDEIGQLARSFNKMSEDLLKARTEITEWSNSLEEKVAQKTKELTEAQDHMVRMERLASLGKLSATVAHEINNPLAGVLNYTFLVIRAMKNNIITEERRQQVMEFLEFIKNEVSRCGDIVKNMLIFAKQTGNYFSTEHLTNLIESGLMLVQPQMLIKRIELEKYYQCEDDQLVCDGGQLRQAFVAIFVNAIEAMEDGGILRVKINCHENSESILVEIQDTGCGIPEDIINNIFDPFFSTKKDGKGVGIGLAVTYGIIQRHKGTIQVKSKVKEGTTFKLELLRNPIIDSEINITQDSIANF
ncbi:HAMP domain-containing protein [candidate division KSB1 bacterium]|nr:HAMP domain-containing protein [candidate division KSB1 bacterium]